MFRNGRDTRGSGGEWQSCESEPPQIQPTKKKIHYARKEEGRREPAFFSHIEERPVTRCGEGEKWGGGLIKTVWFVVLSPCTLLSLALHISLLSMGGSGTDGENEWRGRERREREWERVMRHGYRAYAWGSISTAYCTMIRNWSEMVTCLVLSVKWQKFLMTS